MSAAIKPEVYATWIPNGEVKLIPQIFVTVVYVPHAEKVTADTSRKTKNIETAVADSLRKIKTTETARADLQRSLKANEKAIADTSRKIGITTIVADTSRNIKNIETANADTLREVGKSEKISADTFRKVARTEKFSADTFRQVKKTERAEADTCRRMLERATAGTERKVTRAEKIIADTVIRIPRNLILTVQDSIVNSFKDHAITSFDITLNERTLSDEFKVETVKPMKINDAVQGQFLDYPYSFLVEESNLQDGIQSVNGMYDIDKLLYSFIKADMRDDMSYAEGYYKASRYVNKIAGYFGLIPNIKIDDFIPYDLFGDTNITYSDLISSLFSWTARLPQRQINVFIRGDILHCIQRGKEDTVFDISNIPHSNPVVNQKLIRSMYNNPFGDNGTDETKDVPFTGKIYYKDSYSYTSVSYVRGLLQEEITRSSTNDEESNQKTTYEYTTYGVGDNQVHYLSHKNTRSETRKDEGHTKIIIIADTVYKYQNEFLMKEREETNTFEYNDNYIAGEEKKIRETFHSPVGNGWYSTTVYENGEHQGSTISQGKPNNQVSLYTVQQVRRNFNSNETDNSYEAKRSRLAPIADTSFPVRELDLVKRLTDDLKWLNRKIQETVTVDLISKVENGIPELKHIVDFTERVRLDGVEYFLISNNINATPRSLIQKLQLVRWTE